MASRSGEGADEGGEITVPSSTSAVSDAVALVSPLTLEQTLEPYGESTISHAMCVDKREPRVGMQTTELFMWNFGCAVSKMCCCRISEGIWLL